MTAPCAMFWTLRDGEPRFGNVPVRTIQRDFNALRAAIRSHDVIETERAWEKCERWLQALPVPGASP